MAEQRPVPRGTDPVAAAIAFAIREAVRLEREAAAERRRTIHVVGATQGRSAA